MRRRTAIFLSSIRKYRKTGYAVTVSRVPAHLLGCITKGSGTLVVDDQARRIEEMQPVLLMPGSQIRFIGDGGELEFYLLVLDPVTVDRQKRRRELSPLHEWPASLQRGDIRLRNKRQALERLERLYGEAAGARGTLDDSRIQLMFQDLYSTMLLDMSDQERLPGADESWRQSISYIHRHLHERISLELLAEIAKLTPTSYSRKFKKSMGVSPIDYITRIRIEEAKVRLAQGSSSVKEVSALVGYPNEFYFSRVFKQSVGIAPNLYSRRHTLRIAVAACSSFGNILQSLGASPVANLNCFHYPGMDNETHAAVVTATFRTLRQLKPDLILIDRYHRVFENQMGTVAPTVCVDHHSDWTYVLLTIAELAGREQTAQLQLEQLAGRTYEARRQLQARISDGSLTLLRVNDHAVRIQGMPEHPLNKLIYAELGLNPGSATPVIDRKVEVPPEQLARLSLRSDYLFIQKLAHGPGSDNIMERMLSSPFWQQHEAVRRSRVLFIPNWYAMSWTPGGRHEIINTLLHLHDNSQHADAMRP